MTFAPELMAMASFTKASVDDSTASASSSVSNTVSLLSRLKSPQLSELARKQKVCNNPPPKGAKRSKGRNVGDLKSISPSERLKQFPEENFKITNNKLFCTACREPLSTKKRVIEGHIKSSKHVKGKEKLASKEARE